MVIKRKFDMKLNFFKETKNLFARFFLDILFKKSMFRQDYRDKPNNDSRVKEKMIGDDWSWRARECGRSMIEMLGVLAIIGVLSAGGIAGYSEVMRKFKVNKTIEIFRDSLFRLSELETMNWNTFYEAYKTSDYVNLGLLPESICDENYVDIYGDKGLSCQLPIGEIALDFEFYDGDPWMRGEYVITLIGNNNVKNCIDFLSYHWEQKTPKDWWLGDDNYPGGQIYVWKSEFSNNIYTAPGSYWAQEENVPTELTMSNITQACSQCKSSEDCQIYMVFRSEI